MGATRRVVNQPSTRPLPGLTNTVSQASALATRGRRWIVRARETPRRGTCDTVAPVITQEEALARVLAHVRPLPPRAISLPPRLVALRREILPRRSRCRRSITPPWMAMRWSPHPLRRGRLRVVGEQPAGVDRKLTVRPGEAVRILTGAPLPSGADAVIMQEDVTLDGEAVVLNTDVTAGEFVRRRGGDSGRRTKAHFCR